METEWITIVAVAFFIGLFCGWQLCLKNIQIKKSATYQSNQIQRQWKAAENLANRFANALDIEKKGDVLGVRAYVKGLYSSWSVSVRKDEVDIFHVSIPYRPDEQVHITISAQDLSTLRLKEILMVPGYIGRSNYDVFGAIEDMKEVLRTL